MLKERLLVDTRHLASPISSAVQLALVTDQNILLSLIGTHKCTRTLVTNLHTAQSHRRKSFTHQAKDGTGALRPRPPEQEFRHRHSQ